LSIPVLVAGMAIVVLAVADIFRTTLTMRGAGPVTGKLNAWLWNRLVSAHHRRANHRLLSQAGAMLLAWTGILWVLLLMLGWSLIFLAAGDAIVESATNQPAGVAARIYYAGFTLFTLGVGDYRAVTAGWQMATILCVGNGLLAVTLAITYIVPVLGAVAEKRRLALLIASLGDTAEDIVLGAWPNGGIEALGRHLEALAAPLMLQAELQLAYPALQHMHAIERRLSLTVQVAVLADTLSILRYGLKPEARLHPLALRPAAEGVRAILRAMPHPVEEVDLPVPPPPDLARLRAAGVPLVDDTEFLEELRSETTDRHLLLTLLRNDGRNWDEVLAPSH